MGSIRRKHLGGWLHRAFLCEAPRNFGNFPNAVEIGMIALQILTRRGYLFIVANEAFKLYPSVTSLPFTGQPETRVARCARRRRPQDA